MCVSYLLTCFKKIVRYLHTPRLQISLYYQREIILIILHYTPKCDLLFYQNIHIYILICVYLNRIIKMINYILVLDIGEKNRFFHWIMLLVSTNGS